MKLDVMKLEVMKLEVWKSKVMKFEVVKLEVMKLEVRMLEVMKLEVMKLEVWKSEVIKLEVMKLEVMKLEVRKLEVRKLEVRKFRRHIVLKLKFRSKKKVRISGTQGFNIMLFFSSKVNLYKYDYRFSASASPADCISFILFRRLTSACLIFSVRSSRRFWK